MQSVIGTCSACVSCPEVRTSADSLPPRDVLFIPPNQPNAAPTRSGPAWSRAEPGGRWKANSARVSTRDRSYKLTRPGKSRASYHVPFRRYIVSEQPVLEDYDRKRYRCFVCAGTLRSVSLTDFRISHGNLTLGPVFDTHPGAQLK